MKHGHNTLLRLIALALMLILFPVCIALGDSEEYVAELTINAYAGSLVSDTHAYLTIKNISKAKLSFLSYPISVGDTMSVSIFGDANHIPGLGGVYINLELWRPTDQQVASYTTKITFSQLKKIESATPAESYYHDGTANDSIDSDNLWHNCTTYTVKMWNLVAPSEYKVSASVLGIDAPKWVRNEILTWSGSRYGSAIVPRSYSAQEVYFVTQSKEMIAWDAPKPSLSGRMINNGELKLSWSSAVIKLIYNNKNINSYCVEITDQETGKVSTIMTNNLDQTLTLTDMPTETTYSIRVFGANKSTMGNFRAITGSDPVIVRLGSRVYIEGVSMEMCAYSYFQREWAGASGDLAYAYWCQDRLFGENSSVNIGFGRMRLNTFYAESDQPDPAMTIMPGTHIRTGALDKSLARSYIVMSWDDASICVTFVDDEGIIRIVHYPWRKFYQTLNQEGGTQYVEHWNHVGVMNPAGEAVVSAADGGVRVSGWAVDADSPASPITLRVDIGSEYAEFSTHLYRGDIPYDGNHGFDTIVTTAQTGTLPVKVTALNIDGGSDTVLYSGYVTLSSQPAAPEQIMHIDLPSGTYPHDNNIEVSFWVACNQRIASAFYEAGGVQAQVGVTEDQAVHSAQPGYVYGYRCRGVIDVRTLSPGQTYPIKVWVNYEDGSTSLTEGTFAVAAAPVVKSPVLHIDSPQTTTYSGCDDIEMTGWIASDSEIAHCFYEIASTDGTVAFQGGLNIYDDAPVMESYPQYAFGKRVRGVISLGLLSAHKTYTCTLSVTLENGRTYTTKQTFSVGAITAYNTRHIAHIDHPTAGTTYDAQSNIEISSWVAANAPITYCLYEITRTQDGAGVGQWQLNNIQDAPDVKAAYPDYVYGKRVRGVIDITCLEPDTDYTLKLWYGIGSDGVQSDITTVDFSTGKIIPEEYPVTYDANGGTGAPQAQVKTQGGILSLSETMPERLGYQFAGWATRSGASQAAYLPGDSYTDDAPLTLYAVWKEALLIPPATMADAFDVQIPFGGASAWYAFIPQDSIRFDFTSSGAASPAKLLLLDETGAQVFALGGASNDFSGSTLLDAGKKYYLRLSFAQANASGSYSLNIRRGYIITYVRGDAENVLTAAPYKTHDENYALTTLIPTISRKITFIANGGVIPEDSAVVQDTFLRWNTKPDGSGVSYAAGATYTGNANLTLYPVWQGALPGDLPVPTRSGHTFEGWYTTDGELVSSQTRIRENTTLIARWKSDYLLVSFDMNGGSGVFDPITVKNGESFTMPDWQPTRFGYTFAGWSVSSDAVYGAYRPGAAYTPQTSLSLYAAWAPAEELPADLTYEARIFTCGMEENALYYTFTPEATGRYKLRVAGEPEQKEITVYTAPGSKVNSVSLLTEGSSVYRVYQLTAGKTYTIRIDCTGSIGDVGSLTAERGYRIIYDFKAGIFNNYYCYAQQTDFAVLGSLGFTVNVHLDANGGTVQESDVARTLSVAQWNTAEDGTGVGYMPSAIHRFTENTVLYAQWNDLCFGKLETPVREGYDFDGWYTQTGTLITADTLVRDYFIWDLTLVAHWTEREEEDLTHVKGIESPIGGCEYPMNSDIALTAFVAAKAQIADMVFIVENEAGDTVYEGSVTWDESADDLDAAYADYAFRARARGVIPISSLEPLTAYTVRMHCLLGSESTPTDEITCTFTTAAIPTVTIAFDANGGTNAPDPITPQVGASVPLPEQRPVYTGYMFTGWYTAPSGGTLIPWTTSFTEDMTLYAQWTPVTWKASPKLREPEVSGTTVTLTWDVEVLADAYMVYEFAGVNTVYYLGEVRGTSVTYTNVSLGSHTYAVCPMHKEGYSTSYGSDSNRVTANVTGEVIFRIPKNIRVIEASGFEGISTFSTIAFEGDITSLGDYAFKNCKKLNKITLPASVTSFGTGIFDGCSDALVVYCPAGSAAEAYCLSQGIPCITSE